ncbi:hypothetical protein GCM10010168_10340 [Actinoplanes ianthinogenes]|uniref:Uncharacterized protein n=1 Tax=Actinoplanes ianthinogenes TaxID=122358 RepID=A0ABN6CF91_9ACTN|nr:hypothetical protein [Actinoplanes ianthinogenes]BCJ44221.1 hypothetical protein Aiant_48780 [Actinoplanes ianthinogenes]GGQ96589.1 hypothetical protein GCM10010168_10340 [Actinoplanes ianthinogenes]
MRDIDDELLTDAFAAFRDAVTPYAKVSGAAVTRTVTRRRKRNHLAALGVLTLLLIAVPVTAATVTGGDRPGPAAPVAASSPTAAPSPSGPAGQAAITFRDVRSDAQGFVTEAGGVTCFMIDSTGYDVARCEVSGEGGWAPGAGLPCPTGQRELFEVDGPEKGARTCAAEGVDHEGAELLPNGSGLRLNDLECAAAPGWLRCANSASRHGFTIFPDSFRVW